MKKALLIAEKPSLMRTIETVYDKNKKLFDFSIDFASQVGHLFEYEKSNKTEWSCEYIEFPMNKTLKSSVASVYKNIYDLYKHNDYDFIIHAGDPDQEGEVLVRETLVALKNRKLVKRFWTNDLTDGAVLNALLNLKDDSEFDNLANAGELRSSIDYQYGLNVTRGLSSKHKELFKIGRVKGAIISIIADREKEIANFKPEDNFYPSYIYCDTKSNKELEFSVDYNNLSFKTEDECNILLSKIKDKSSVVTSFNQKNKQTNPPSLFTLASLQQEAFKNYKWNANKTLSVLQILYEKKVVSYPRTDCPYISSGTNLGKIIDSSVKSLSNLITMPYSSSVFEKSISSVKANKKYCNNKAISEEGHTAIIPTESKIGSLSDDEQKLYILIAKRFLSIFLQNKITRNTNIETIVKGISEPFIYKLSEIVDPGFASFLYGEKKDTLINFGIKENDTLKPITFNVKKYTTVCPSRYNPSSLIKKMENPKDYINEDEEKISYKIGTPATRAKIIEECIENGYITSSKNNYYATPKALFIKEKNANIELFDITETGIVENKLRKVRTGEINSKTIYSEVTERIKETMENIKNGNEERFAEGLAVCPKCGGQVVKGKFGLYCANKCGMYLQKAMGQELTDAEIIALCNGKKIKKKAISKKTGSPYEAYFVPSGINEWTDNNGNTKYSFNITLEFINNNK